MVKQINKRLKGTERSRNDGPQGAEGILQLRVAYLCDVQGLTYYLRRRPRYPYVRRPGSTPSTLNRLRAPAASFLGQPPQVRAGAGAASACWSPCVVFPGSTLGLSDSNPDQSRAAMGCHRHE